MKILLIFILGLIIFSFGGCGDDNSTDSSDGNNLVPLGLGSNWIGTLRTYSAGNDIITEYPFTYQLYDEVVKSEETWYSMRYIIDNADTIDPRILYVNRSDGLWEQCPYGNTVNRIALWGQYPTTKGQSFLVNHVDYHELMVNLDSVDIDNIRTVYDNALVVSTDYEVTVPAGTFSCYKYKWQPDASSNGNLLYFYVAPNFGFVKKEEYHQTGGYLIESWELDYYIAN